MGNYCGTPQKKLYKYKHPTQQNRIPITNETIKQWLSDEKWVHPKPT